MKKKEQSAGNENRKSNTISDALRIWFYEHFYPTPPEEQLPSLRGLKSGMSFRFSKDKDSFSPLLYFFVLLLVVGCLISAVFS